MSIGRYGRLIGSRLATLTDKKRPAAKSKGLPRRASCSDEERGKPTAAQPLALSG